MPRLLIFAACEKVIVGQEDNSGSLISIMQGFDLPVGPPEPVDASNLLMAPVQWYAFALWEALPGDLPGRFRQKVELVAPDGALLLSAEMPLINEGDGDKRFHRAALKQHGFVIRTLGDYVLRLFIRDGEEPWVELPDRAFPIPVRVAQPQATTT
jgi:hypothetical protein